MEKKLGKISSVKYGFDDRGFFGLQLCFDMNGSGTCSSYVNNISERQDFYEWTEEERRSNMADNIFYIAELLKDAKVEDVYQLLNIPVEVTIDRNMFKEFRILTEVL